MAGAILATVAALVVGINLTGVPYHENDEGTYVAQAWAVTSLGRLTPYAYTYDHAPQASMHALVLRSPHAHARFTLNATRAKSLPGIGAILTADDVILVFAACTEETAARSLESVFLEALESGDLG